MRFSRVYQNRLNDHPYTNDTVVVIDVLRSFTTAAVALDRGASAVYPVEGLLAAGKLLAKFANSVSVGAIACADYIESLLRGDPVVPETFAGRVRESDFGRRFSAGTAPSLPPADLDIAAHVDRFQFSMPVLSDGEHLVIRKIA